MSIASIFQKCSSVNCELISKLHQNEKANNSDKNEAGNFGLSSGLQFFQSSGKALFEFCFNYSTFSDSNVEMEEQLLAKRGIFNPKASSLQAGKLVQHRNFEQEV